MVGVVAEFQVEITVFRFRGFGSLINNHVQHVSYLRILTVEELMLDVQVLSRNPEFSNIDAVITNAVGCFLGQGDDVLGQYVFELYQFHVIFITQFALFQREKLDENSLSIYQFIIVNVGCVTGIHCAAVIQAKAIIPSVDNLQRTDCKKGICVASVIWIRIAVVF